MIIQTTEELVREKRRRNLFVGNNSKTISGKEREELNYILLNLVKKKKTHHHQHHHRDWNLSCEGLGLSFPKHLVLGPGESYAPALLFIGCNQSIQQPSALQ